MKIAAIIAVAGFAGAVSAQTVIDLSGMNVDGAAPTTFTVNQTDHGPLDSLDFNLTAEAVAPSWGSEINVTLTHVPSGWSFNADGDDADFDDDGPADFLFGWGNSSGVFSFQGSVNMAGQGPADTFGEWRISLSDDFDDGVNPDHFYHSGSTITINKIPAPGALALLGLGGVAAMRRRR